MVVLTEDAGRVLVLFVSVDTGMNLVFTTTSKQPVLAACILSNLVA